ncbi:MAG: Ig-like domain-containing protein [Methanobrevibacter sp.]|nr:Ig-like domain-containing protein [Methanobrevibacter sp.]
MKKFLVSTANVFGYDSNDNLLFTGTTLMDSSIETTLANTDVRAGQGNQLQYIYYHTAEMNITINEAQFSLPYLALNVGSAITTGANVWTTETVTVTAGAGSVSKTPLGISGTTLYGWVTDKDDNVQRVEFTGSSFSMADNTYNGDVCVRYYATDAAAQKVTVYADMLPSTIRLVMEAQLCSSDSTTNRIGTLQINVPKASMTGAFTLSMTPDSVAQTPLSVRALSYTPTNNGGCTANRPIYAEIIEILDGRNWYDNVVALAIEGGDFSLSVSGTKQLKVFAIPNNGTAAFLVDSSNITFASSATGKATVSASGLVTGVSAGDATIKATITGKTDIDANVVVTVA